MKFHQRYLTGMLVVLSTTVAFGCFGPFAKKKSSGGGGSSASTQQTTEEKKEDDKKPAAPTTPAAPASAAPGSKEGYGCLQGVIIDGYTGQRLDFTKFADPSGVFVLIRDQKLKAKGISNDPNLVGEYHICDIPVEDTYPVFAYLDGYEAFESSVIVDSTRAIRVAKDGAVDSEVKIPDPVELKNIVVWPRGTAGRDLVVKVVHNGDPVKGAIVDVEPQAGNGHWGFTGALVNSADDRILPLARKTTDDDGNAVYGKGDLTLGHSYKVSVTADPSSNLTSSFASRTVLLGISGATASDENTFELVIALDDGNKGIKLVSCSKQFSDYNTAGAISFIFNRDITTVNPNAMVATLANPGGAVLVPDVPGDVDSEQVVASASGVRLTLTPLFSTAPKAPDPAKIPADNPDRDVTVSYDVDKVFIRVTGDNDANYQTLDSILTASAVAGCIPAAAKMTTRFFAQIY